MRRGGEGLRIMTSARSPSALGSLGTAAAAWGALKLACRGFGADVIFMTAVLQECGHGWGAHTRKGDVNVEGSSSQAPLFLYWAPAAILSALSSLWSQHLTCTSRFHVTSRYWFSLVLLWGFARRRKLSKACCDTEKGAWGGSASCQVAPCWITFWLQEGVFLSRPVSVSHEIM